MRKTRIAINGFGRIGRAFLRIARSHPSLEVVAINDLGDVENLAYLLSYDSTYGKPGFAVSAHEQNLVVDGKGIPVLAEKDPANLPWEEFDVDIVIESTGLFEEFDKAKGHLTAGAKRVVITAPAKGSPPLGLSAATVLMGVNEEELKHCIITSNASCTTNAASPLIAILHEAIGIEKALLNTTHAYTATQNLIDGPTKGKDFRRGRAGAENIAPSSTGAAIATTEAFPDLRGKFDGIAIRVPVIAGSIVDITFLASRSTTAEEVNRILTDAAAEARWSGIFTVTTEQLVSSDIIGSSYASIADLNFTRVVGGDLVKVLAWYDNESGYANVLLKHVLGLSGSLSSV